MARRGGDSSDEGEDGPNEVRSFEDDDCGIMDPAICSGLEPRSAPHQTRDCQTVPEPLRIPSRMPPLDLFGQNLLNIPRHRICTMDAFSKSWASLEAGSDDLHMTEVDGGSWVFCESCVAQIPKRIQEALYFFHTLLASIQDLRFYGIPSQHVSLRKKRGDKKVISDFIWHKARGRSQAPMETPENGRLNMNYILSELVGGGERESNEETVKVPPFRIRLGFTGALYGYKGEERRGLFVVLMITWCRNFDLLGYINENFLRPPCKKSPAFKARQQQVQHMEYIWKKIARDVAFKNLNLNPSLFGLPEDYADNRGGKLGVDCLFNMFNIPFQVHGIIQREILEKERRLSPDLSVDDVEIENLRIVGMPSLSMSVDDEATGDYVRYMHAYVWNLSNEYYGFMRDLRAYNKPKDKESKKDEGNEDGACGEACVGNFNLSSVGGWPLRFEELLDGRRECTLFGAPPIPIWLDFRPEVHPDSCAGFDNWLAQIGGPNGIPELTKTCLRSFLVQELTASQDDIFDTWGHFLHDSRPANPSLVLEEYYGENADPLSSLVTPGHLRPWWKGIEEDIKAQRSRGMSILEAHKSFTRYLQSSMLFHKSSIKSGAFRSNRVAQALDVWERVDFRAACADEESPCSMRSYRAALCHTMSRDRQHDIYQCSNEAFWKAFEALNKDFMMNSSNLEFMIEALVSEVMWMMGQNNRSIVPYMQGLKQAAGNGHFMHSTKEGTFPDDRKPNSTGMDWTLSKIDMLYQMILDIAGFMDPKQNMQTPMNFMGWTPASLPLMTNAMVLEGQIKSLPDPSVVLRPLASTEIRQKDDIGVLIKCFPRNPNAQNQIWANTADTDNSNLRKQTLKFPMFPLQFCALSSNVANSTPQEAEQTKTFNTILSVMPPGSGPFTKKQKTGEINNSTCNASGSRQNDTRNRDQTAYFLPYSHMRAAVGLALMNMSGSAPLEVSPVTLAFLDWIFFYVRELTEGMLDKYVSESFKRMKDGYEARQVAKSLWVRSIAWFSSSETEEEASMGVLCSMFSHALPIHEVVPAAHSFLCRSLHMGCLLMISCLAKHLEVPILSVDSLRHFFESDEVPAEGDEHRVTYDAVRGWLQRCLARNRFCPENAAPFHSHHNVCPYITSDGAPDGTPTSDKDCVYRIKKSRTQVFGFSLCLCSDLTPQQDEVHLAVGRKIKDVWGRQLFETCHMGPEPSIYWNAMHDLVLQWVPDFRQLVGGGIYDSARLFRKMGLDLPGLQDWPRDADRAPAFARTFAFVNNMEVSAVAIGVHWVGLLLCVAFAGGDVLHPKISSNFARNMLREITRHAPPAATPGDNIPVRSFHLHTSAVERVVVPKVPRPAHFLRPIYDWHFANTGTFAYTRAVGRFLPEDCLHCGALFRYAELFACDILELPGKILHAEYELMPNTHYSIWRQSDSAFGSLIVRSREAQVYMHIVLSEGQEEVSHVTGLSDWRHVLTENDYIVTPMIWRRGAAVITRVEGGDCVGCIVPAEDGASNFDPEDHVYHVLAEQDGAPRRMGFIKALRKLIPVGTEVFVKLQSPNIVAMSLEMLAADAQKELLAARITVPPMRDPEVGKIYVTCIRKPIMARLDMQDMSCVTIAIDPWDLALAAEEGQRVVPHLCCGLRR